MASVTSFLYHVTGDSLIIPFVSRQRQLAVVSVTVVVSSLQVSGVYEGITKAQEASHEGTGVIQEGVEVAKKRAVEAGAAPESCQVYTSGNRPNRPAPASLSCSASVHLLS